MIRRLAYLLMFLCALYSCTNDIREVNALLSEDNLLVEESKDVRMIYSDSAKVSVIISGPRMLGYLDKKNPKQVLTDGVKAEFLDGYGRVTSYLEAKYAVRDERNKLIHCKDSVVIYNANNEKLETSEIFWQESDGIMRTDKFIRITQPTRGDTTYGVGFESNEDFTSFTIKNKFSAKMTTSEMQLQLYPEKNQE